MHLLDVNLLIALCDASHVHHDPAHDWFRVHAAAGWATCPITENALLRIMGHPNYPGGPGAPAAILPLLRRLRAHPGHIFLEDSISIADGNLVADLAGVAPKMLTDLYLLALAVSRACRLATLDQHIDPRWVTGGANALVRIRA